MPKNVKTLMSSEYNIREELKHADLVIGSVLIPGAKAPKLVTREMLKLMEPGTVMVDVAIDQGGCFETSHPTTHEDPVYYVDGILHYCVARDVALCAAAGRQGLASCGARECGTGPGPEHRFGKDGLPAGCRGVGSSLRTVGVVTADMGRFAALRVPDSGGRCRMKG